MLVCKVDKTNITLIIDGKPTVIKRDHPNADKVVEAAKDYNMQKDKEVRENLLSDIMDMIEAKDYRAALSDDFEIDATGNVYLNGTSEMIPHFLAKRLKEAIDAELDIQPLIKFWKHLLLNPDKHTRGQLFSFLEHNGHPITSEGYFLAYKAVDIKRKYDTETGEEIKEVRFDEDTGEQIQEQINQAMTFKPYHNGAHGMEIKVGQAIQMPREACDNDPHRTCSAGLHVGSMDYVATFGHSGGVILEVLVNPRNVVAVPADYNNTKMRCCEYFPIAISNGENEEIFLESDYTAHDKKQMEEDMKQFQQEREDKIAQLEAQLAEMKAVSGSIYL